MIRTDEKELKVTNRMGAEIIYSALLLSMGTLVIYTSLNSPSEIKINSFQDVLPRLILAAAPILLGLVFLLSAFNRKPKIIINSEGISCIDWPFTFIPWEHVEEVGIGSMAINGLNDQDRSVILQIFLKTPSQYESENL